LYSYFKSDDSLRDCSSNLIAASCVHLAELANRSGSSCAIQLISSAFSCSVPDILRMSSRLSSLYPAIPPHKVEIPVFYACVCDFGLSKVCSRAVPLCSAAALF
jgi:hypothetical protein